MAKERKGKEMYIGLTGGIGSGKSTVSEYLKEMGCAIVDADLIARLVVEPGRPALSEIAETFGKEYLFADGTLDRKKLGRLVFSQPKQLARLNEIMARRIREEVLKQMKASGSKITVLDAPMLLESGLENIVDQVWIVDVPDEIRVKRVMLRDSATEEEVRDRMKAQMSREERLAFPGGRIIDNSGSVEETRRQVALLLQELV